MGKISVSIKWKEGFLILKENGKYRAKIEVHLKRGHSDPEGETTAKSLNALGYDVEDVKVAKVYKIIFKVNSFQEAFKQLEDMCVRLLANPVKDDYFYDVGKAE